eukprot:scaffold87586_cov32-Tisochrysis_lutea.AAC.8
MGALAGVASAAHPASRRNRTCAVSPIKPGLAAAEHRRVNAKYKESAVFNADVPSSSSASSCGVRAPKVCNQGMSKSKASSRSGRESWVKRSTNTERSAGRPSCARGAAASAAE